MDIRSLDAAQAYARTDALKTAQPTPMGAPAAGPNFSQLVNSAIDSSIATLQTSEQKQIGALTGAVSLDDLTAAVTNAEMTLRTVVAIRDKIVSAYQDIIKMPI